MRIIENLAALAPWVGKEVGVSDWVTISQQQIDAFAAATGDRQWIHVDVERARRESPFGGPIAHGFLTLSLLPALNDSVVRVEGVGMGINYGLNRIRFVTPVPAGGRVRSRVALKALEPLPPMHGASGVQATWDVKIELEGADKPACVAEFLARYYA